VVIETTQEAGGKAGGGQPAAEKGGALREGHSRSQLHHTKSIPQLAGQVAQCCTLQGDDHPAQQAGRFARPLGQLAGRGLGRLRRIVQQQEQGSAGRLERLGPAQQGAVRSVSRRLPQGAQGPQAQVLEIEGSIGNVYTSLQLPPALGQKTQQQRLANPRWARKGAEALLIERCAESPESRFRCHAWHIGPHV